MSMLDATERTRPIMQYVRDLEALVMRYRNRERKFNLGCFVLGVMFGAGAMSGLFLFLRSFRGT